MRKAALGVGIVLGIALAVGWAWARRGPALKLAPGWRIELVAEAPDVLFPTAIVQAPDGTLYVGQDPMDMPGPATEPIDSVVALKGGKTTVFADRLWAVMGLEWLDDTLFVVHAPYLSAFRDADGDGRADQRVDLVTGLGPKVPGFNGMNDHVASGVRLGMDGFLYVSVGDKGIPDGVGRDGTRVRLHGGGVIRVRPDGTGLEVVSTGERNPLSVALNADDDVFTFGNDDDSKAWPNSLTHHVVGGHYGYPHEFQNAKGRCLPVVDGRLGGAGAQGVCYNEDGLAPRFRGNLFFCDWGLHALTRYEVARSGGTFRVVSQEYVVRKGSVPDFRPFSVAVGDGGRCLYLVDWAFDGYLVDGPKTGRIYRLTYEGPGRSGPAPKPPRGDLASDIAALDHPSHAARLDAQRDLARRGDAAEPALVARLHDRRARTGRVHALWALDALDTPEARRAIRDALTDTDPGLRAHAARSAGIRRDRVAVGALSAMVRDPDPSARREAAIALGRLGDPDASATLMAALGDPDPFVAWSVRRAIRTLGAWDVDALAEALLDGRRHADALKLTDEAWALPVVEALNRALAAAKSQDLREAIVANLAGQYRRYPEWTGSWFGTNPLAAPPPSKTRDWDPAGMSRVLDGLTSAAGDPAVGVRRKAIAGLVAAGPEAAPALRAALASEADTENLAALAAGLGTLGDRDAVPALARLLLDRGRPESVRLAALDGLGRIGGPDAAEAVRTLARDANAPAPLLAHALALPASDQAPRELAGFLGHDDPGVRAAALASLADQPALPGEVERAVLGRLDDRDFKVRRAAMNASAALGLAEAVPTLMALARRDATRADATLALAARPDPRALAVYLDALGDRNPEVRRAGESALVAVRDVAGDALRSAAASGRFVGPATDALDRVLTRFRPLTDWRVIGPLPATASRSLFAAPAIDFGRSLPGPDGRPIVWSTRAGDPDNGRVALDDLRDADDPPDLAAVAETALDSGGARTALVRVEPGETATLSVNGKVARGDNAADPGLVRVDLKAGRNRLRLRVSRGAGRWTFGVQVSESSDVSPASGTAANRSERLRAFAMGHDGDPRRGEALFFAADGVGCAGCHSVNGRGTAAVGPDLTGLALKFDRAEIIRSVLEPSNRIAGGYHPVVVATRDGRVLTGVVRGETGDHLDLVDARAKVTRVAKDEVEDRRLGVVSVMPAGLADPLTEAEFADLIGYLSETRAAGRGREPAR